MSDSHTPRVSPVPTNKPKELSKQSPALLIQPTKNTATKIPASKFADSFSDGFRLLGATSTPANPHPKQENDSADNSTKKRITRRKRKTLEETEQTIVHEAEPLTKRRNTKTTVLATSFFRAAATRTGSTGNVPAFREASIGEEEVEEGTVIPWVEKYAPMNSRAVALHARKLKDVRDAIQDMCSDKPSIKLLILSGPAGSSKSAIVRTLAKEVLTENCKRDGKDLPENYLIEWENPDRMEGRSLPTAFPEFLASVRFKMNSDCLILVDDLPNLSHLNTKQRFNDALREWVNRTNVTPHSHNPGLVLIITEIELTNMGGGSEGSFVSSRNTDSMITERLIMDKVLKHPATLRIKFRAVNKTLITKSLKNIVSQERDLFGKLATKDVNNMIDVLSGYGDIRAAIMAMEFWAIGRSRSLSSKGSKTKPESDGKDVYLDMLRRDAHLDLFHAIGKVVHLSSKDKFNQEVESDIVVNSIISDWASSRGDQQTLSSTIFENYLSANMHLPLAEVTKCMDSLCDSDLLAKANNHTTGGSGSQLCIEMAGELDVRGVRNSLRRNLHLKSKTSGFRPMSFPQLLKRQPPEIAELKVELEAFREHRLAQEQNSFGGMWSPETVLLYGKLYTEQIMARMKNRLDPLTEMEEKEFEYHSSDFESDFDDEIEKELDEMMIAEQKQKEQTNMASIQSQTSRQPPAFIPAPEAASDLPSLATAQSSLYEDDDAIDDFFNDEYDKLLNDSQPR